MVEIISRGDGPRPMDARIKALLDKNRSTIVRLADHLTQGQYSASKAAKAAPSVQFPRRLYFGGSSSPAQEIRPCVRASLNGRVIVVDENSGKQLHHLGEIRRRDGAITFVLARQENGFSASAADDLLAALDDLDRAQLAPDGGEEALVAEIAERLGVEQS